MRRTARNSDFPHIYLMMNKPLDAVCASASDSHPIVFSFLDDDMKKQASSAPRGCRLHTVGRLDANSSGLLLLTTDGRFSHHITAPESAIKKTYLVTLKTPVTAPEQQSAYSTACAAGLTLPPDKKAPEDHSAPAQLEWLTSTQCRITVTEGKFHEVRRIFLALGNEVTALHRLSIGSLQLDKNLAPGQWRALTAEEVKSATE
ncbi:MAG: pseudouridine synthase [Treponema sp.]|nr:pseudouridine synthase [Treponema sp.]